MIYCKNNGNHVPGTGTFLLWKSITYVPHESFMCH